MEYENVTLPAVTHQEDIYRTNKRAHVNDKSFNDIELVQIHREKGLVIMGFRLQLLRSKISYFPFPESIR